ncbi:MAG: ElyC/SanA/YdcF family protein [Alphaproteobacteria bacterium]|nr:ElyC/SanA/YdcF family protein [Alphaproteobacteria bacterium]
MSRRQKPFFVLVLQTLLVIFAFWLGGLIYYAESLPKSPPTPLAEADGIVALTGGSGRLDLGLDLLREGKGQRLLISGVDANLSEAGLRDRLGLPETGGEIPPESAPEDTAGDETMGEDTATPADGSDGETEAAAAEPEAPPSDAAADIAPDTGGEDLFSCCIDVDRAENTIGNASEIADWAKANDYQSLIVVTASYHLPRAMLEIRRALPGVELTAYPVVPKHVKTDEWYAYPGTARLLAAEYTKYLASLIRQRLIEPVLGSPAP